MPVGEQRTMVTVDPGIRARATDVAALTPVAVAANLDQLDLVPNGVRAYLTCGDDDARAYSRKLPPKLVGARALFLNAPDALVLTGADTPEAAAEALADWVETVVITVDARSAVAIVGGRARRGARLQPRRRSSTPRATATCCAPPSRGPTCAARSRRSASAGRSSTLSSRWASRPPPAAPSPRSGCSRRARSTASPGRRGARLTRMNVRPATAEDAATMAEIFVERGPRGVGARGGRGARRDAAAGARGRRARRRGRGAASSASRSSRAASSTSSTRSPEAWGRGAGRALLVAAEHTLREAGCTEVTLWTEERNERARRIYQASGWRPDKEIRERVWNGAPLRELRYRKLLAPAKRA